MIKVILALITICLCNSLFAQSPWISPVPKSGIENSMVVVWFDQQLLPNAESYITNQNKYAEMGRKIMRDSVVSELKRLSEASFATIEDELSNLKNNGLVGEIKRHWIINGFSCRLLTEESLDAVSKLPNVDKIFFKPRLGVNRGDQQEEYHSVSGEFQLIDPLKYKVEWNIKAMHVDQVWKAFHVSGENVLNVIHDYGLDLNDPVINKNIYQNPDEIPDNNIDDDNNGLIDDYNGYNFIKNNGDISKVMDSKSRLIHGNAVTGIICGRAYEETLWGVAPNARWGSVIAHVSVLENSIEWAIGQDFDTYNMSFSIPGLGEYRTHLRKIMEQGAYCGLFFISGAGNYANEQKESYAPIPVQMRFPEDIPEAVFSATGVDRENERPVFSSQGPVLWNTSYYNEGLVNKPDFCTINYNVPYLNRLNNMIDDRGAGNSFAAPHLAGVINLILSLKPELKVWEVKEILINSAVDIMDPGYDFQSGYGFIDAFKAIESAIEN